MKLAMNYVILYVSDLENSLEFYSGKLGLPIKMRQDTYVELDTGAVTLSMIARKDVKALTGLNVPEEAASAYTFEVGFVVEDVAATIETLRQEGVTVLKDPVTKPWGQTVAYVADPDGHYIEICTKME